MKKPEFKVNGHRCSYISSPDINGRYELHLDRAWEENTIEAIEKADWTKITVEKARDDAMKCWLPDGYTFRLERIGYLDGDKIYVVTVRTDKQSYGDVTPYQAQIDGLNETVALKEAAISTLSTQLAEADELAATLYEELEGTAEETSTETAAETGEVQA